MLRTALRLATLAALTNGGNEPYPTLVKDQVFDSRRDALTDIKADMRRPAIIIRTDDDLSQVRNDKFGERRLDLLLELSVMTASKGKDGWEVGWPETDPALEATLDQLEFDVGNALFGAGEWALWWRSFPWPVIGLSSRVEYARDKILVKLALRTLTLMLQPARDCYPTAVVEGTPIVAAAPKLLKKVFDDIAAEGAGSVKLAAQQVQTVLDQRGWPADVSYPYLLSVHQSMPINLEAELLADIGGET